MDQGAGHSSKGWAEMVRKVYEVRLLVCPQFHGRIEVVAFRTGHAVADRIFIQQKRYSLSLCMRI
jgi:hypothetical protein